MEQNNSSRFFRECGDKKWSKERRLVVLVGLLVVLIIAPVTALPQREMCLTDECIRTATRIIEGMDRTVAPCQDFYKFACSGWISSHSIPPSEIKWSQFEFLMKRWLRNFRVLLEEPDRVNDLRPLKLARALYKTCMDTDSAEELKLTPIFEMFSKLGLSKDLLLFDNNSKNDTEIDLDLSRIAGVASRYLEVDFFVLLSKWVDHRSNPNKLFLEVKQISSVFSELDFTDPENFKSELIEYKHYIKEMVELAGVTGENSTSFADEILEFSTKIAKIMVRPEESADPSFVTISELQTSTDASALRWNWTKYFEAVFENTDVILAKDVDQFIVKDLEYLKKLPQLLSTTPRVTIARFVWWSIYSTVAPKIFEKCSELESKLKWNMMFEAPRWERCVLRANSHFRLVLANVYMQRHVDDQAREKAMKMFTAMRAAFTEMLSESKWMDVETRERFRKKLYAMRLIVGFPQWTTDHEKLNKFYKGAEVIPGDKFGTFLRLTDVNVRRVLKLRGKSYGDDWLLLEDNWAGSYHPDSNSVLISETVLQPLFYSNGLESINYGALGMLMAHEISHGFDTQGVNYDENDEEFHGCNKETTRHYREKVECIIKQYSSYHLPELGENIAIDGEKTLNENISDNVGIRVAYRAYQRLKSKGLKKLALPGLSNYTQDQLFFLSFAQTWCGKYTNEGLEDQHLYAIHSPNHFRVMGTLSNNKEFSKAWNCGIGSPMNPSNKCVLW